MRQVRDQDRGAGKVMEEKHILLICALVALDLILSLIIFCTHIALMPSEKTEKTDYHLEAYLSAIEFCETSGYREIVRLDSNNKLSYGAFQFQFDTFKRYGQQYGFIDKEATDAEIKEMIMDYDLQRSIAREMVKNGLDRTNWKICYKKLNGQ